MPAAGSAVVRVPFGTAFVIIVVVVVVVAAVSVTVAAAADDDKAMLVEPIEFVHELESRAVGDELRARLTLPT